MLNLFDSVISLAAKPGMLTSALQPQPQPQSRAPDHFNGLFTLRNDADRKPDKEEEKKVKGILERLRHYGVDNIVESNVEYALQCQSSQGDPEAAFRLLMLLEDTYEGIVKPYDPNGKFLGAVNREGVTCFLDALLFAMFARLDSFEAMLYENFTDAKRKRLAGLLRLWVNMLRTGRLITTDITVHIQQALADCGWADAERLRQQDPSEAFTFITAQLELPMLTLKMDMHHAGKEDPQDDHKFVNERLLEVAILDEPLEGNSVVTLEDCLEHYFNNRIEVKRYMESQRRNTLKSATMSDAAPLKEKESGTHVEVLEVGPQTPLAESPAAITPLVETPSFSTSRVQELRPSSGRKRADSIFSQRRLQVVDGIEPAKDKAEDDPGTPREPMARKLSTRTEVLMPAWQFFKLLPWYTDNMPTSDAQVAAHFSKKRPVLGICLKRYSYTYAGQARRLDTYVDIPLEIAVPNFVSDDTMHEEGPLVGNFRLMLQSVVCHRGVSVNSGHYICLCRGRAGNAQGRQGSVDRRGSNDTDDADDPWMRFDDLAKERVSYVDIHEALKKEMPYLLFYQVQPIGDDGHSIHDLPSYTEATSRSQSDATPLEKPYIGKLSGSENALNHTLSEPSLPNRSSTDVPDFLPASERTSIDAGTALDAPRGRPETANSEERRRSITFDTSEAESIRTDSHGQSVPSTPSEEKGNSFLAVANKLSGAAGSRRGSRVSKTSTNSRSRPTSTGPPDNSNRFSLNMSKLTQRMSNNKIDTSGNPAEMAVVETASSQISDDKEPVTAVPTAAADPPLLPPPPPAANPVTIPANPSKESIVAVSAVKPLPKVRKEKDRDRAVSGRHKRGHKHEDRDCVVM